MAAEAKREAILRAAQDLLVKHGLRGTSMEAIARQARIAKPTLYAYFPDKIAIFQMLVDTVIAEWRDNFVGALGGEGDIVQRVGAALTAKNKGTMRLINTSPHAAELYDAHDRVTGAQFRRFDAEIAAALEAALAGAGVARARLVTQMQLAASFGNGHKATNPAELGPALRLLAERLIRPELPPAC
jgi:AcrR family transcriptional regulator